MPHARRASGKRLETRRRLVEAAIEIVARHGFHGATVSAIARRAGFSVGAVYANFRGKDDLFLAVFEEHMRWFEEQVREVIAADDPAAAFEQGAALMSRDRSQFLVFVEFWAYAVRRAKLRHSFAARLAEMRAMLERALEERAERTATGYDLPVESLALIGLALGRGLTLERFVDPDAVPEQAVGQLLGGLLTGTSAPR